MYISNRNIIATTQELLDCQNNTKNFTKFLNLVRSSGWLSTWTNRMHRAYRKADHSEWTGFIEHGLWKTIERADERIVVGNLLKLAIRWAKCEYKKLYANNAQKTEDESDAMEKDCDGQLTDILIPDVDPRFEDVEIRDFLCQMEKNLSPREMHIFREIMENETTLRELGSSLNLSHERIRQLMESARKKGLSILSKSLNMTPKACKEAYTRKMVAA